MSNYQIALKVICRNCAAILSSGDELYVVKQNGN